MAWDDSNAYGNNSAWGSGNNNNNKTNNVSNNNKNNNNSNNNSQAAVFQLDPNHIVRDGYVEKRGGGPLAGWKKRYIILYANNRIEYYTDNSKKDQKGTIDISRNNLSKKFNDGDIHKAVQTMKNVDCGFKIECLSRQWEFRCESDSVKQLWIETIRSCITGEFVKKLKEEWKAKQKFANNMANNNGNNAYDNNSGKSQKEIAREQRRAARQNRKANRTQHDRLKEEVPGYDKANAQQQAQIQSIQQRTDNALDSALRTTNEIEETAFDTAYKLDSQRNQLLKIDNDLHDINSNLDETEDILKGMKSLGGALKKKMFGKKKKSDEYVAPVVKDSAFVRDNGNNNKNNMNNYDDPNQTETDEKLDQVLNSVKRIHNVTNDINTELDEQDKILDSINNRMDKVDQRLNKQTRTIKKIH